MEARELQFSQQGKEWVAEETVNNDYSLHLERKKGGYFHISQRSSDTGTFVPCALPPGRKAGHEKLYKLAFYMK